MIKKAVDIDDWYIRVHVNNKYRMNLDCEPSWAYSYLSKNGVLELLLLLKKTKRKEGYLQLLKAEKKETLAEQFECNAKGQVVFKWGSASEKTMFIMKWS